ncbi:MAG: MmgE/PrpD family protein [Comamonadaceae bacterium]|nr:MAG: MmgE/PrpD family protein [Comamonadaceae bacterium]
MGLSLDLAQHVARTRFADLPASTVRATKRSLLDALGVALAASTQGEATPAFLALARVSGSGPCRIIGHDLQVAPAVAALVNGAMSHALDYEDTHDAGLVHPNGTALPAALAAAQLRGGVTGAEFITAMAVGADLTCRLGMAMGDDDTPRGWVIRPLLGTCGAVAAAGKLLGLPPAAMVEALGLAFSQVTCTKGFFGYAPSHMREIRDGLAAQAAVTAVLLAQRGVRCYDQPLEGAHGLFAMYTGGRYDAAAITRHLGAVFEVDALSFKPWPSCRGTHPFVEAALTLRSLHGLRPDAIAAIDVDVSATFGMLCAPAAQKQRPQTANDAKFSIPFTAAAALVHGRLGLADFTPAALADSEVLALAARTTCSVRSGGGLTDALRGTLRVTLRDGRVVAQHIERPLGDPARPMDDAALAAKFADCARYAATPLAADTAAAAAAGIALLDTAPDLAALAL